MPPLSINETRALVLNTKVKIAQIRTIESQKIPQFLAWLTYEKGWAKRISTTLINNKSSVEKFQSQTYIGCWVT